MGVSVPAPESPPDDTYTTMRRSRAPGGPKPPTDVMELKRVMEIAHHGRASAPSQEEKVGCQKFLEHDRRVLRFRAVWDDRGSLYGQLRFLVCSFCPPVLL